MRHLPKHRSPVVWIFGLIPVAVSLWVWLSPLAFVPVPWPDDSAFYFVAKDFFRWPPRWVMLPQAPFEPTYRIINFNTMPLFPILIGIGRWLGIDGSFGLKLWPLSAWAASGTLLTVALYRRGLPVLVTLAITLAFSLDPILRWGSVLVRPESLVGLLGMTLVLGLSLGFPKRWQSRGLWDPVAALLALAAYTHFNAVHLLFPVVIFLWREPRRMLLIATKTVLYLIPWIIVVAWHWSVFLQQMSLQWTRLAILRNSWLDSPSLAIRSLFGHLGSPEPWPAVLLWTGVLLWILILCSLLCLAGDIFFRKRIGHWSKLAPPAAWVLGTMWLWDTKPESWFIYYIHIASWSFAGLAALVIWNAGKQRLLFAITTLAATATMIFGYVDLTQAARLESSQTWHWNVFNQLVDCVDDRLSSLEKELDLHHSSSRPFRIWCPTYPDITVELSRRHPDWELTRANDFRTRNGLALRHGREVDAVVVTEIFETVEKTISAPAESHPETRSLFMTWRHQYLHLLWTEPGWKLNRFICQRGRWQAFLFMTDPAAKQR